ncbi:mono/diheme cytochrome c family protein [Oxalobacteraceae bacterium GrIS 1.18]
MKKTLIGLVCLVVLGAGVFYGLSWHAALAAIPPPSPDTFSAQQIERGAMLAGIGNCASCHTVKGGAPFAGGLPIDTPFGTVYSSNITPAPGSGIGNWSEAAFKRALHEGVRRDGSHLFPVFPYTHFVHVTDDDVAALYAFLMTRAPVDVQSKANTLPFPLNQRILQAGWKWLYFDQTALVTDTSKTVDWNRGRYLAEGLAHCSSCHTPRNALGAEKKSAAYAGAPIDGWYSPPLTAANPAPLAWSEADIYAYLRTGSAKLHGVAIGPMAEVVHHSLALASDADIHALAVYFSSINGASLAASGTTDVGSLVAKVTAQSAQVHDLYNNHGAALYVAACASCHSNSDSQVSQKRPELGFSSTLLSPTPDNLLQVILFGVDRHDGMPGLMMPGYGAGLSDADVAQLASYLRSSRTALPPWENLEKSVAVLRHAQRP